jgi:hypothetical protein
MLRRLKHDAFLGSRFSFLMAHTWHSTSICYLRVSIRRTERVWGQLTSLPTVLGSCLEEKMRLFGYGIFEHHWHRSTAKLQTLSSMVSMHRSIATLWVERWPWFWHIPSAEFRNAHHQASVVPGEFIYGVAVSPMDTEGVVLLTASGFYGNGDTVVYRRNTNTKLLGSNVTIQIGSKRTETIARVHRRNKSMVCSSFKRARSSLLRH